METIKLRPGNLFLVFLIAGVCLAVAEFGNLAQNRGALLVTLVFWTALAQGSVAAVAATELTNARWIASLRRELLSIYPFLLFLPFLFLLLVPLFDLYSWTQHPGAWLNKPFFLVRNLLLMVCVYVAARLFIRRSLRRDPEVKRYAVIYLFIFVTAQSLVAFDWVMSLEYPWFSTLFGAYFFVEAIYAALALAGVAAFLLYRGKAAADAETMRRHLSDLASLIFGFGILWGGLFFAQYLLLWYGNLPEEAGAVYRRVAVSPFRELCWIFLVGSFVIPFFTFLSHRAKENPVAVLFVCAAILLGQGLEKLVFIMPVVSLHAGILVVQNVLLLALWLLLLHSRRELLPD